MLGLAKSNLCYFGWTVESERNAYHPYPAAGVDLARTDPIQTFYVGVAPRREGEYAGAGKINLVAKRVDQLFASHLGPTPPVNLFILFIEPGPAYRINLPV